MNFKVGQRVWCKQLKCFGIVERDTLDIINHEYYLSINIENSPLGLPIKVEDLHETADDMFERLGYKDTSWETKGWYLIEKDFGKYIEEIRIDLLTGDYKKSKVFSKDKMMWSGTLTKEEHQAIHQKLIELGWLE